MVLQLLRKRTQIAPRPFRTPYATLDLRQQLRGYTLYEPPILIYRRREDILLRAGHGKLHTDTAPAQNAPQRGIAAFMRSLCKVGGKLGGHLVETTSPTTRQILHGSAEGLSRKFIYRNSGFVLFVCRANKPLHR